MSRPAIRSHADIASRCTRDERTGCLNWMGFAKGERGRPQMYLHDIGHVVSPDKMLHFLAREAGPVRQRDERRIYHPMCGNHLCCERAHHKLLTPEQVSKLRAPRKSCGIRTYDDIVSRCVRDEDTGCLIWQGSTKARRGRPEMRIPALGRVVGLSVALHALARELGPLRQRDERRIYHPMCGNRLCCERAHHKLLTKGQINRLRRGVVTAVSRAKISQSRKAAGRGRITPEQRAEIKGSSMSLKEIAARYSVSITYACVLRSGRADVPRDRAGLMPGLAAGASVFAWGGAA